MPPLKSNPNVIVPASWKESEILYEKCKAGELDGFQLFVHSFVEPDGAVGTPAYIPANADPKQITPALIEDGVTNGPLLGWALKPTEQRHTPGYGNDVGSDLQVLRTAMIEYGLIQHQLTRSEKIGKNIKHILGKLRK